MVAIPHHHQVVRFGVFEVNLTADEIRKAGIQKLVGQPFQVLKALLERPEEVVTREELRSRLWPEKTFVDYDLALKKAINRVRLVLGDSADSPRFIETVPRLGYRFIAPVMIDGTVPSDELVSESLPSSQSELTTNRVRLLVGVTVLVILFIGALVLYRGTGVAHTKRPAIQSLAVLPLKNLSG